MHERRCALEDNRVGQLNVARIAVGLESHLCDHRDLAHHRAQRYRSLLAYRGEVAEAHGDPLSSNGYAVWIFVSMQGYDGPLEQRVMSCNNSSVAGDVGRITNVLTEEAAIARLLLSSYAGGCTDVCDRKSSS